MMVVVDGFVAKVGEKYELKEPGVALVWWPAVGSNSSIRIGVGET